MTAVETGTGVVDHVAPLPPGNGAPWRVAVARIPGWTWLLAGIGGVLGILAASALHRSPLLAVGGAVAVAVLGWALVRPLVALVLLQAVAWSNISTVVGKHGGISVYLVAIAVSVLSVAIEARRRRQLTFGRSPLYWLLALVIAAEGVSLQFSTLPLSLTLTTSRLKDLVFFACTVALINFTGRPLTAVKVMVVTIAVFCGLTVVQQYGLHNATTFGGLSGFNAADIGSATRRHTGPEVDPNFWGRTIVLVTPLAFSILLSRIRARRRWWPWALAGAAMAAGEYLSQSRGGLIALAIAMLVWMVIALWHRRRLFWLVPVGLLLLLTLVPSLAGRLATVGQLSNVSVGTTDPSLVDRIQVQEVGLAIFRQHPVTGVGLGNFEVVEPGYLGKPGIIDTGAVFAPHDLYLQIASEQGLVGLGAWALFFGGAIVVGSRAFLVARRLRRDEEALVALGAVVGLVGWGAASAVLHLSDFNELLAVVAVVAVLDWRLRNHLAEAQSTHAALPSAQALREQARRRRAHRVAVGSVFVAGAVSLMAVSAYIPLNRPAWDAKATFGVRPRPTVSSDSDAYAWDVINRQSLIPTLVDVIDNPRFTGQALGSVDPRLRNDISFAATGNSSAAVLTLSVTAPDPVLARHVAGEALTKARNYIRGLIDLYQVDPVSTSPAVRVSQRRPAGERALLAVIGATLLAAAAVSALIRRRMPTGPVPEDV